MEQFWQNNARARALFDDLAARMERGAYDDDYLSVLGDYQEEAPATPNLYIFAARYLLAHGVYDEATRLGERAYRLRSVNCEVWKLLAAVYKAQGRELESITMQGYAYGLYLAPALEISLTPETHGEALGRLSVAAGMGGYAPIAQCRAVTEEGVLSFRPDTFVGEFLPLTMPAGSARFWAGCYAESSFLSDKSYLLDAVRGSDWFADRGHRDCVFDLQKAREVKGTAEIVPDRQPLLVPIAGTEIMQELSIRTPSEHKRTYLGKWAFSYFRFDERTVLEAKGGAPYAVGMPVPLGHSPRRRKLVLNILVDGLSWPVVRTRFPACMPQTAAFFSQGAIFDRHFSTSEHTYAALPAIETGRYPQHTQIFNERDSHELPLDYRTLSECMKHLGYYCAAPMASGDGIYCGVMRGYDRLITTSWQLPAAEGVDRAIHQIEAFDETDQFLYLHIMDVHPWDAKGFKFATTVETHLPLPDRLPDMEESMASVRLPNCEIYQAQFWDRLRHADRSIGMLLSYIAAHFAKDEYIINLYSDHGVSIFSAPLDGRIDIIGENSTGAVWMMRGAGVPAAGMVNELTSIVDIYPTLGALCGFPVSPEIDGNLPAVFGGKERDAVYSMSLFPGRTYKLAVRSKTHALRLETREVVDEDGTVDIADARVGIYPHAHELAEGYEMDSNELRAFFYPRAREFVRPIANNGEFWPAMRAARPQWFGEK